jgi:hypothetical protein
MRRGGLLWTLPSCLSYYIGRRRMGQHRRCITRVIVERPGFLCDARNSLNADHKVT